MAGLLKSLPPRATRTSDSIVLSKTNKFVQSVPVIKGGKSLYERIADISAIVNTKLGKYAESYQLIREEEEVLDYFDKIIQYGQAALDTETSSLDPITTTLAGICLYVPGSKSCYMPMHHISYVTGVESNNQVPDELIKECLIKCEEKKVKWVLHNSVFDKRVLRNQVGVSITPEWDTMLAACCLNENESHRLKDLHLKYCDSKDSESFTYDKLFEGIPFTHIPITVAYLYSAGDPIKTWELMEFQKKHLTEEKLPGVYNVFHNIEMPVVNVVCDMEDKGIYLDKDYANHLSEKYHLILQEREQAVYSILDEYKSQIDEYKSKTPNHKLSDPIGIGSPTQVAIVLYDILKCSSPDPKKPRGTGEEILTMLNTPFCKALLEYRETAKLLSTYVDKLPQVVNQKTGRIHCRFKQYGAATGRFSSSDPNLQNIPSKNKEIRKMFRASEGNVLISADYSQQEPRLLASQSGDQHLIEAYAQNKDIYAWIAEKIYKVPYDECKEFRPDGTKNPEGKKRRDSVKSIILGIMYGRGAKAIAEQLGCSTQQAQKIVDTFFDSFPQVKKWMNSVLEGARDNGYVETAWGRKRRLPDVGLAPYEFKCLNGSVASNFDPLDFGTYTSVDSDSVDPLIVEKYTKKLDRAWGSQKRDIINQAYNEGIKITDNGGKIADAERQCVNSIIQGSAADVTKNAMICIHNNSRLKELGCHLIVQVHDEVICECPEQNAKECCDLLSQIMIESAKERVRVPMKVDCEVTYAWYGEAVEV